jgi:hypothetical protein
VIGLACDALQQIHGAAPEAPRDLEEHRDGGDHLLALDLLDRAGGDAAALRGLLQGQPLLAAPPANPGGDLV